MLNLSLRSLYKHFKPNHHIWLYSLVKWILASLTTAFHSFMFPSLVFHFLMSRFLRSLSRSIQRFLLFRLSILEFSIIFHRGDTAPKSQDRLKQLLPHGLVISKASLFNLSFRFLNGISLLHISNSYSIVLTRLAGPRSRPYTSRNISRV